MAHSLPKKIIVVEDDADIRNLYQEILVGEGYHVELACDGKEALAILADDQRAPCLILTDFMMPGMNGGELVHILRQQDCLMSIPVVMISARPVKEAEVHGVEFIKKPVDVDTIVDRVKHYCGIPSEDCPVHEEKVAKAIEQDPGTDKQISN